MNKQLEERTGEAAVGRRRSAPARETTGPAGEDGADRAAGPGRVCPRLPRFHARSRPLAGRHRARGRHVGDGKAPGRAAGETFDRRGRRQGAAAGRRRLRQSALCLAHRPARPPGRAGAARADAHRRRRTTATARRNPRRRAGADRQPHVMARSHRARARPTGARLRGAGIARGSRAHAAPRAARGIVRTHRPAHTVARGPGRARRRRSPRHAQR